MTLKQTALDQIHIDLGAVMTDFAGWNMPLRYGSETQEHILVRTDCGLFDLSHMGEIWVEGEDAARFLDFALVGELSKVAIGRARYTMICNESGNVIDDLVVYRIEVNVFMVVANASNVQIVFSELSARNQGFACTVKDLSESTALIAVQGPSAVKIVSQVFPKTNFSELKNYGWCLSNQDELHVILARTGYTGEDGFEIFLDPKDAVGLWQKLIDFGAKPAGLACRDTLRLEAGMPLYGHELDLQTNPIEAGLGRVIAFGKSIDFIGKSALAQIAESSTKRNLVGITLETRRIARAGFNLINKDGEIVGQITSGAFSPTLNKSIAMAYLDRNFDAQLDTLSVDIRGTNELATLVPLPFYQRKK
jgi:aminomethyltransferase